MFEMFPLFGYGRMLPRTFLCDSFEGIPFHSLGRIPRCGASVLSKIPPPFKASLLVFKITVIRGHAVLTKFVTVLSTISTLVAVNMLAAMVWRLPVV